MCGTFQMSLLMWTQLNLYDACRRERWVGAPRSCDSTCPPKSLRVPTLHMNISCVTVMFYSALFKLDFEPYMSHHGSCCNRAINYG